MSIAPHYPDETPALPTLNQGANPVDPNRTDAGSGSGLAADTSPAAAPTRASIPTAIDTPFGGPSGAAATPAPFLASASAAADDTFEHALLGHADEDPEKTTKKEFHLRMYPKERYADGENLDLSEELAKKLNSDGRLRCWV